MSGNRVLILAGEASGDLHASGLIRELLQKEPSLEISCVGGHMMKEAGAEMLVPSSALSVVGLFEVFSHLKPISSAYLKVKRWISKKRPDLLILVDFPEFNLMMAGHAKALGIPVFYYISPQVWAWRQGRVKKIKKLVDKMAVILPFEEEFFRSFGIDATFVGHPLLDSVDIDTIDTSELEQELGLKGRKLVCLLPGSRCGEVKRHLPLVLDMCTIMKEQDPGLKFCVALGEKNPPSLSKWVKEMVRKGRVPVSVVEGRTYEAIKASDICVAASGTVTLEAAIIGTPMVVIYKVSSLSYHLGRRLIKVPWVSLVNLIAQREVVPELLQNHATPQKISRKCLELLENPLVRKRMQRDFEGLHRVLGEKGVAGRTADMVLGLLNEKAKAPLT